MADQPQTPETPPQPDRYGPGGPTSSGPKPAPGQFVPYGQVATATPSTAKPGYFKRGFGTGLGFGLGLLIAAVVLSVVSALLTMMVLGGLISAAGSLEPSTSSERVQTVWGKESASTENTVNAIEVKGTIMAEAGDGVGLSTATYGYEVARRIDAIDKEDTKGLLLLLNTPGGTINGSKAIADAVTRYQERTGKKVIAYVRGMSASGGMMAMAGADTIIADHGTLVGSIGVIFGPFQRYQDVVAIGSTIIQPGVTTTGGIDQKYLSKGRGKDFGNPFRDMTEEEQKVLLNGLDKEYNNFVNWVAKARDLKPEFIKNELGAFIFDPETAKQHGLIDEEMGTDEAFKFIAKEFDIDENEMRVVVPKAPGVWDSLLGSHKRVLGQAEVISDPATPVTAVVCRDRSQIMAVHGSLAGFCGN